jgi:glycosyltransferase involved in cell wall biosynthesis
MDLLKPENEKLLVIGHQWPEPQATAAGVRIIQLLRSFQQSGYEITFASTASPGLYGTPLEAMGIRMVPVRLNHSSFDQFLAKERFETVLFDRFMTEEQFGWRVREVLPKARLVLDTEDLHALRHSREKALARGTAWQVEDWVADPLFPRELASIFRCDLSLIISRAEMDLLRTQVPFLEGKLLYSPFQIPQETGPQPSHGQRKGFLFVGNGRHRPNLDAIAVLREDIWPALSRELPGVPLHICGAYLPKAILNLHAPEMGFEVLGWVPDVRSAMQEARLQLAPLRFGAGIKGKVLSALASGLPTLTSGIGWEGILGENPQGPWRADSPEEFTRKAVALYRDRELWEHSLRVLSEAARPHYAPRTGQLNEALKQLKDSPARPGRETLIIQRLLRDQAFDRLRYLSKWIEAKESRQN